MSLMENDDVVILDVRTPMEYEEGHIANSHLLDYNSGTPFIHGLYKLDKDKTYLVYCRSGVRSAAAAAHMSQIGFDEVYNLIGGILNWEGPVVK